MSLVTALKHLFTPQESNAYKSKVLHNIYVLLITAVIIATQIFFQKSGATLGYASQIPPSEVIRLTNEKRREMGVGQLFENVTLSDAALQKGKDMLEKGYWAHVSPDGTEPWYFFGKVGYKYRYAGENLARDFSSPQGAIEGWMASPSHKENMLSPKYKEIGVAVVEGNLNGRDATIIVQLFGTKASDRPLIPVASAQNNKQQVQDQAEVKLIEDQDSRPKEEFKINLVKPVSASENEISFSTSYFQKYISLFFVIILSLVILADGFLLWKKKLLRQSARPFAQLIFIMTIVALVLLIRKGTIL